MKNLIQIIRKNKLIAFIIKSGFRKEGLEFFTPDRYSQQLAYMNRPKGYIVKAHIHPPTSREIKFIQEVLFIKSGRLKVDFYDEKKHYIESRMLEQGDVVFLAFGGHSFRFMEDTEIIEVKQGPFLKKDEPVRFEAVAKDRMRLKK